MAKQKTIDAARPMLNELDQVADTVEHAIDVVEKVIEHGADKVEKGLEVAADVLPELVEHAAQASGAGGHKLVRYFRDPKHAAVAIIVVSTVAGAGLGYVGYRLMKKQLESKLEARFDKQLEERLEVELAAAKEIYERRNKEGVFATPQSAAEALLVKDAVKSFEAYAGDPEAQARLRAHLDAEAAADEAAIEETPDLDETAPTTSNVFVNAKVAATQWDHEAEVAKRGTEAPYIITEEEFNDGLPNYDQGQVTWYEGDQILADSQEVPIIEVEATVGMDNLMRFGQGTDDPNAVYIRNPRTQMDFEVARSEGSFSEEVQGFHETELRHTDRPKRTRRGRWDDGER